MFDTHTHFDFPVFKDDLPLFAKRATDAGIHALLIAGYQANHFQNIIDTKLRLDALNKSPKCYMAVGLHPAFVEKHQQTDLAILETFLDHPDCVAIGEIGLDTYTKALKQPECLKQQKFYFANQLAIAKQHQKPVILHIRKSHADALKMIKDSDFQLGGIAHSFSGGVQEAKAFVDLGFKLGITAQVCNPNAKKLHKTIKTVGKHHLVMETDCPDMLPYPLQHVIKAKKEHTKDHLSNPAQIPPYSNNAINEPANLPYVLTSLSELLGTSKQQLQTIFWQNSLDALNLQSL